MRIVDYEGAIWLDLGRDDGSMVRITAQKWEVVTGADAPLYQAGRDAGLAHPEAQFGGAVEVSGLARPAKRNGISVRSRMAGRDVRSGEAVPGAIAVWRPRLRQEHRSQIDSESVRSEQGRRPRTARH